MERTNNLIVNCIPFK